MTERRHETTIAGVTAWAEPWRTDSFGVLLCDMRSEYRDHLGSIYVLNGTLLEKHTPLRYRSAEGAVFAAVMLEAVKRCEALREAAEKAQGGGV